MILYLWQNDKTVVIGKNQNPLAECNLPEMKKDGIKLARRLSGGGAVYHDAGNLNFTFISADEPNAERRNMKIICRACKTAGIDVECSGRNDITADGKKFSGNAFYHSGGKFCHHGTLLIGSDFSALSKYLTPSKLKLEAKGIKSVRSRVINLSALAPELTPEKMSELIVKSASELLDLSSQKADDIDIEKVQNLSAKYSSDEHLYGKTAPYTLELFGKLDIGEIRLRLNIIKGNIADIKLYTDAMDGELSDKVEAALQGGIFDKAEVQKALRNAININAAEALTKLIFEEIE